jgi:kynurenine formamidase
MGHDRTGVDAPIHFIEDGGEFNQIERNLAMICATLAHRSVRISGACPGAFATVAAVREAFDAGNNRPGSASDHAGPGKTGAA